MNTTSKNKKLFFSTTLNRKRAFSVYIISALVMLLFLQCINSQQITDKRTRWLTDVDGNPMIMFPNSVLKVGDTFYIYGEWCFEDENSGKNVLKCYSSKDLTNWKFEANVLTQEESHLVNRGSMVYNPVTKQYVYCYKYRLPMHFPGWKSLKAKPVQGRRCPATVKVRWLKPTHLSQVARPMLRSHHTLVARRWNCISECNPVMCFQLLSLWNRSIFLNRISLPKGV